MIDNNYARLRLFIDSDYSFDLDKFNAACIEHGYEPMHIKHFASHAGLYMIAKNLDETNAQEIFTSMVVNPSYIVPQSSCNNCGGSSVR